MIPDVTACTTGWLLHAIMVATCNCAKEATGKQGTIVHMLSGNRLMFLIANGCWLPRFTTHVQVKYPIFWEFKLMSAVKYATRCMYWYTTGTSLTD